MLSQRPGKKKKARKYGLFKVEHTGLEPVASTLPVWRAPSCANAPALVDNTINPDENQVLFFQLFILFENREIRK